MSAHRPVPAPSACATPNPRWEECPNAPGVVCKVQRAAQLDGENTGSTGLARVPAMPEFSAREALAISRDDEGYDEIDRRLLNTFPASDAVARY